MSQLPSDRSRTISFTHSPGRKILQASPPTATSGPSNIANVYEHLAHHCLASFVGRRHEYCALLGVSLDALTDLSVGLYRAKPTEQDRCFRIPELDAVKVDFFSFPTLNARDGTVGILFISVDGRHWFLCGSHGVISPSDWNRYSDMVIVTQSPLDVLAMMTLGVGAVAVTDPDAAQQDLIKKLKRSTDHRAMIVVDNGDWGRQTCRSFHDHQMPFSTWTRVPESPDLYSLVQHKLSHFAAAKRSLGIDELPEFEVLARLGDDLLDQLEHSSVCPHESMKPHVYGRTQPFILPLSGPVVGALRAAQPTPSQRASAAKARCRE